MNDPAPSDQPVNREGWWTRDHALIVVLVGATALLLILCWQLVRPFLTPIAWALALAVVAHPLHGWIARRIKPPGIAAGLTVFLIAIVLVALASFVGHSILKKRLLARRQSRRAWIVASGGRNSRPIPGSAARSRPWSSKPISLVNFMAWPGKSVSAFLKS